MATLHNAHNQLLQSGKEILRVTRSRIAPVPFTSSTILRWRNVHTAELGADDRGPFPMGRPCVHGYAGVDNSRCDGMREHLVSALGAQDAAVHF